LLIDWFEPPPDRHFSTLQRTKERRQRLERDFLGQEQEQKSIQKKSI